MTASIVAESNYLPAEDEAERYLTAFELGRYSACRCYCALHRQLFPTRKSWKIEFDEACEEIERNLLKLWPHQSRHTLRHFIDSGRMDSDDEQNHENLIRFEASVLHHWQNDEKPQLATNYVTEELKCYVDRLDVELRQFVLQHDYKSQLVSRFFELGQALWECVYPYRMVQEFASVELKVVRVPADGLPAKPYRKTKTAARKAKKRREPQFIRRERSPGTIKVSKAAIKVLRQRVRRVVPPLLATQRDRLLPLVNQLSGQIPQERYDDFEELDRQLRECISTFSKPAEVAWNDIRVDCQTGKVWWGRREPLKFDDKPGLRLLYWLLMREGQIPQLDLVERLWNDEAKVQDHYCALRKVVCRLNTQLRPYLGPESPRPIIVAYFPNGGRRKYGPEGWIKIAG
jgi:ribosome-associated translation inhibitor RaiA